MDLGIENSLIVIQEISEKKLLRKDIRLRYMRSIQNSHII